MAAPVAALPAQARSRALMLATMLGLAAYVLPLAFAPYNVLSVWLLLLPPLSAWLAVDGAYWLHRRTGLPHPLVTIALPLVVGLAAGALDGAVMDAGQTILTLWGLWTGTVAGIGAWLVLRRIA